MSHRDVWTKSWDRVLEVGEWLSLTRNEVVASVVLMVVDAAFTSIGLNYFTAVVPKVEEFSKKIVETGKIKGLKDLALADIDELRKVWKTKRSWIIAKAIASYLSNLSEDDRLALRTWAKNAKLERREDPIGGIKGVGLITFQYLRMMGGVDTGREVFRKPSLPLNPKQIMPSLKVFADEYLPEVIIKRESEQERIRDFLESVLKGMNKVLCMYGKPGAGKTLIAKHVLNQFDELGNNASVYLNASALSPNLALKEVYEVVCGENSRRLSSPSMISEINKRLLRKSVAIALTLDNFDRMDGIENLLWNINHVLESIGRVGLILISTSEFEIRNLVGGRLFSRLKPEFYEFKPYSAERLYEILEHRVKWAYGKLIIDEEALSTLCDCVAEECDSNVRYLFKLFLNSADVASRNGESIVGIATVKEVIEKEKQLIAKSKLNAIKKHTPRMYEVLRIIAALQGKQQVYTGLIKEAIRRRGLAIGERSLDYYLNNLESKGLIELRNIGKAG